MIIEADGKQIGELTQNGFCMVDFYSDGCGPCNMLARVLNKFESLLPFISVIRVNITQFPQYAEEFGITATPTLLYFNEGKLCEKSVGYRTLEQLQETAGQYLYG